MRARGGRVLLLMAIAALALPPVVAQATIEWRMRLWMLPPMDVTGDNARQTRSEGYHDDGTDYNDKALDWQSSTGESTSKIVRFRAVAGAPDDTGGTFLGAYGEPTELPNVTCTSNPNTTVHYFRVKVRSDWDGLSKGKMSYAHVQILDTAPASFDIWFHWGGISTATYNSVNVAETVSDAGAPVCWTGYHVHENNSTDSEWDKWNDAVYDGPTIPTCDCFQNDDSDNWTRRQTWTESSS